MPTDQNTPEQNEGTQQPTQEATVSMSAYQKLQQKLQKANDQLRQNDAKLREGETLEQAYAREQQRASELEKELQLERVRGKVPQEFQPLVDSFMTKYGFVPDEEDLALLKPARSGETQNESSGLRNAPAGRANKPNYEDDDYLRSVKLTG